MKTQPPIPLQLGFQHQHLKRLGSDITKSILAQGKHEHVWTHNYQLSSKELPAKLQVINDGFQAI